MLGQVATGQGDHRQALEFLTESRGLALELENTVHLAQSLLGLGVVLSFQGDYAQAMALCTESLELAQECGNTLLMAWTFKHLGNLAQRQGNARQARSWLANSLALFLDAGDTVGVMAYLEGMAEIAGLEGQPERIVRLFGAAAPLHARFGVSSYPAEQDAYDQQLLAARAQLGEGAYAVAWNSGQAMSVEQAVEEALRTA
jgi:tetratricopeptide (TPR) repeat protein